MTAAQGSSRFKTDVKAARGLGAAHHGVGHFIYERATGLALVPLALWAVFAALTVAPAGYGGAVLWLSEPLNAVLLALLVIVGFVHLRAVMQVVIEDYIHKFSTKAVLLLLNTFVCALAGALGLFAILKVAVSGAY